MDGQLTAITIVPDDKWDGRLRPGELHIGTAVMLACPLCGEFASLHHRIERHDDGTVSLDPSVGCPHDGCGAHFFVRHNAIEWQARL